MKRSTLAKRQPLPVRAGDAFLVLSGSGSTATALGAAMEANKLGAGVGFSWYACRHWPAC